MKRPVELLEHPNCGTPDCCGKCNNVEESESWETGYKRKVVKTTDAEHKEKPSQEEFNKQMKRVAGHEFGG